MFCRSSWYYCSKNDYSLLLVCDWVMPRAIFKPTNKEACWFGSPDNAGKLFSQEYYSCIKRSSRISTSLKKFHVAEHTGCFAMHTLISFDHTNLTMNHYYEYSKLLVKQVNMLLNKWMKRRELQVKQDQLFQNFAYSNLMATTWEWQAGFKLYTNATSLPSIIYKRGEGGFSQISFLAPGKKL